MSIYTHCSIVHLAVCHHITSYWLVIGWEIVYYWGINDISYWLNPAECCLTDGTDVLYNKFNVDSSSPPDNPPQHPNSAYSCVVATTGQWRVSRCDQQHRVVCQSDHDTLTGIMRTSFLHLSFVHFFYDWLWAFWVLSVLCTSVLAGYNSVWSWLCTTVSYFLKLKWLSKIV